MGERERSCKTVRERGREGKEGERMCEKRRVRENEEACESV